MREHCCLGSASRPARKLQVADAVGEDAHLGTAEEVWILLVWFVDQVCVGLMGTCLPIEDDDFETRVLRLERREQRLVVQSTNSLYREEDFAF